MEENYIEHRGIKFHEVRWYPKGEIKGIIHIIHGVTEYINRYSDFAQFFNDKGYMVVGYDLCGHGKTSGTKMYFGNHDSWFLNSEDIYFYYDLISKQYKNIPYIFLGFSLGSFLLRTCLIKHNDLNNKCIIMGTGYQNKLSISLAKYLVKKEEKKYGYDKTSKVIDNLTFDNYNKKINGNLKFSWLCSNEDASKEYESDLNRGDSLTIGLFNEMLTGINYTCDEKNIKLMNKNLDILLLGGLHDPVGNNGKGLTKIGRKLIDCNIKNVTVKLIEGRHDLFHELDKMDTFNYILKWIEGFNR